MQAQSTACSPTVLTLGLEVIAYNKIHQDRIFFSAVYFSTFSEFNPLGPLGLFLGYLILLLDLVRAKAG